MRSSIHYLMRVATKRSFDYAVKFYFFIADKSCTKADYPRSDLSYTRHLIMERWCSVWWGDDLMNLCPQQSLISDDTWRLSVGSAVAMPALCPSLAAGEIGERNGFRWRLKQPWIHSTPLHLTRLRHVVCSDVTTDRDFWCVVDCCRFGEKIME